MGLPDEKEVPSPDSGAVEAARVESTRKGSIDDLEAMNVLGYKPEMTRNRSMFTLLFQSLAIAAIPYGEGGPLISAIYGGGQLSIFLGWIGKMMFVL